MALPSLNSYLCIKPSFALCWSTVPRCGTLRFQFSHQMKLKRSRNVLSENQYDEALVSGCSSLSERRLLLCKQTFKKICQPTSRLNNLVPEIRAYAHGYELRNNQTLTVSRCRTERFKRSFIPT